MGFHFPLETVYRFRQSVEHQQELLLRAANQRVARVRHLIEQLDHRLRETHAQKSQALGRGSPAAELRFTVQCETFLHRQRRDLEAELLRLQQLRDKQQKVFQHARRERETIESLRDRELREYERDATRREQRRLDDLFLLRQILVRQARLLQISQRCS